MNGRPLSWDEELISSFFHIRPSQVNFKSCIRRHVEYLSSSNDLTWTIRGLDNRVFCMNNEPWKIRKPITKTLALENGKTETISGYCYRFHGRYRTSSESQELKELNNVDHENDGKPKILNKQVEDMWNNERTPSPVMIGTYKEDILSKNIKGFGWPSPHSDQFYSPTLGISKRQYTTRLKFLNSKIYWEDYIGTYKIDCKEQFKTDLKAFQDLDGFNMNEEEIKQEYPEDFEHFGCHNHQRTGFQILDLYCNGGNRTVNMITGLAPETSDKLEISTWPIYNSYPSWNCGINGSEAYVNPVFALSTVEDNLSKNQYTKMGHQELGFNDLESCQEEYLKMAQDMVKNDKTGNWMTKDLNKISIQAIILRVMIMVCVFYLGHRLYLNYLKKKQEKFITQKERDMKRNAENIENVYKTGGSSSVTRTEQCDLTSESGSSEFKN